MAQMIRTKPIPSCPECGSVMVLRQPKEGQDWEAFWGCSKYPRCKGTRQIDENGLPETDFLDED